MKDSTYLVDEVVASNELCTTYFSATKATSPLTYALWKKLDSNNVANGRDKMIMINHSNRNKLRDLYYKFKYTKGVSFITLMTAYVKRYPDDYATKESMKVSVFDSLFKHNALIKTYTWYDKLPRIIKFIEKTLEDKENATI